MDDAGLRAQKTELRKEIRDLRNALSPGEREERSRRACLALEAAVDFAEMTSVGLFMPIGSEIDPTSLAGGLRAKNLTLALPVTIGRTGMLFRQWLEHDILVDAGFGTRGPDRDAPEVIPDCLVMPLLAFDDNGNRLGYGAGHYDRYISERIILGRRPLLIGLAYSIQQLDNVPIGRYDLPLDMIATDQGMVTPAR